MSNDLWADWVASIQSQTEATLNRLLPDIEAVPQRLHQAMRYAMLGSGKRVRPLLCHASGEMFGAPKEKLTGAACAVELIHGYSLVHDDLPCMDNDVLRRGKPTCHVKYGEAMALLAGDGLQALAFGALSDANLPNLALRLLADAAGSRGMAGGQGIDLDAVGRTLSLDALENMHLLKTGALIRAAVLLGALSGNASDKDIKSLSDFASTVGLLFQVTDDILDAESNTAALGKTAGKDAQSNKPTYVSLLGLDTAKQKALALGELAEQQLNAFGSRANRLRAISHYIATRER